MDRPRRTLRPTNRSVQPLTEPVVRPVKRKATPEAIDPQKQLKTLLESAKSDLVALDMHDIINKNTWDMLSDDARRRLAALLPRTAFVDARPSIGADHPSVEDTMAVDDEKDEDAAPDAEVNLAFFTDPHFLAAERTFQDHLYLNWFSEAHCARVEKFKEGIKDGTLAAPWKDQVWDRDNVLPAIQPTSSFPLPHEGSARAGIAAEIKLYVLVKNDIIRVGDIIAYKRCFTLSDVTVEKDAIIHEVHPKTYALTIHALSGTAKDLPAHLLSETPTVDGPQPIQSMTITSPTMLETALLELDGRIDRARRPNGNAWKSFTIWRWRGEGFNPADSRGGRENHGTLFYLRACYSQER
ncbi:hypothetical protein HYPSUDRAFT_206316 [Hypholoma sublateritium FD-334 SS-4]|uniref:ASX DEUBAD domain-containing protein n=1 Tax=Hypholoma sublateritium (strain FD-334 SS-4) TaxID=945553 RepID=A0A0D2NDZ6_HYPSF|nr:hypothetical protein HYPSUDRAFT_206316 [Hypholoma sublateritium FD-334 SS-4]